MPHVVLTGAPRASDCIAAYKPIMEREGDTVTKTGMVYLAQDGKAALIDALVIEKGDKAGFYVLVSERDDGVVVRLDPLTDPPKTPGVKQVLALIAQQILAAFPDASVGKTNLEQELAQAAKSA